ncbi:MAG: hypothetical protein IPJ68_04725 [Candidatus Moraniibacteriota bacterium]|nr:MAG: hypothetical protein IPJ68_04725 [Candidatus Moranbacteria bacterium]
MNNQKEECCLRFDPTPWDNKEFSWENKRFIKDKVCTVFYMPINFGQVMKRITGKVENAGAQTPEYICLSDHTSKWNMDLYLAVDKEISDAENVIMSGKYFSKVYEGNFKETGTWMKDFENTTLSKGYSIKKRYLWYTTCPKCAKKYGHNYVVIVGQIL